MTTRGRTTKVLTQRYGADGLSRHPDQLIVEEPLEIHLDGVRVATTMRTPGNDFELAIGFCHTEGLLAGSKVRQCRYCGPQRQGVDSDFNIVNVDTGGTAPVPEARLTIVTSACGMCGTTAIDQLGERLHPLPPSDPIPYEVLAEIADHVEGQELFQATGAVHAAVAFSPDGTPAIVREDIGRHNAVDKVVGRLLIEDKLPMVGWGLWVSGRASFEIVQKAWAGGFGTVVAVSAPSSLAVRAARAAGLTLAGFARQGHLNIYAPAE